MTIGVLLLAAGKGQRFGSDKRKALLPSGQAVLTTTLQNIQRSGLPVLVCLDAPEHELATTLEQSGVTCVLCEQANQGMGHTLATGVQCVPAHWDGVLVALADMPWIEAETYRAVAEQLNSALICRPVFAGEGGHPVGFGRGYFGELARLRGDRGARELLDAHAEQLRQVTVTDPGILRDIDRPEDIGAPAAK